MAMFGSGFVQPRGPGVIPGDLQPMPVPDFGPQISLPEAPKKKGGLFGNNVLPTIAGALADYFMMQRGMAPMFAQQRMRQRDDERAELQRQHDRENQFQDFVRREAYKAANKPPEVPEILERVQALNSLRPGLGDTYAQNFAQNGGSLFGRMFTDPSTGQQFMLGGQAGSAPQIGQEVDDPRKGGPGLAGPGGFPGSY